MALRHLHTWAKRLVVATGGLALAVSLGKAAATFGSITGPTCSPSACTFSVQITAMSNPDKLVCLEYATFDFKNRCNSGNSGGDPSTTTGCSCVSPACNPTTGVGTWTCSGPPSGTSTVYWAIATWTSGGGGGSCGGEATFGACGLISPLAVTLSTFAAEATPDGIALTWETVSEADNAGFRVLRSETADGERSLLAFVPAAAPGSAAGSTYRYVDATARPGRTYWYWLEDVDLSGAATLHGPVSARAAPAGPPRRLWLPLVNR